MYVYLYSYSSLIHSWQHVSVLANHLQASTKYMDMVHLVSAYITGLFTKFFILKSSVKSVADISITYMYL
jgi:hypothetical protein